MLGLHEYTDVHAVDIHLNGMSDIQSIAPVSHPPQHHQAFLGLYWLPEWRLGLIQFPLDLILDKHHSRALAPLSGNRLYCYYEMKNPNTRCPSLFCESLTEYLRYERICKEQSFAFYGSRDWEGKVKGCTWWGLSVSSLGGK